MDFPIDVEKSPDTEVACPRKQIPPQDYNGDDLLDLINDLRVKFRRLIPTDEKVIHKLIKEHIPIQFQDEDRLSALHWTTVTTNHQVVMILITGDSTNVYIRLQNNNGDTALHVMGKSI
jgi:ankyrin repeat protein